MEKQPTDVFNEQFCVKVAQPSDSLYDFLGYFFAANNVSETLQIEHTLWTNMKIAHDDVYLLTVFVGPETRTNLTSKKSEEKFGKTDEEINQIFKIIFLILVSVSLGFLFLAGNVLNWKFAIDLIRIFTILSSVLPFMLKLNVDFSKLFYSYNINNDKSIEGAIVRNSQIPEELGRVEYLLSDKTGTLTRNEMVFKNLCTFLKNYGPQDFLELKEVLLRIYAQPVHLLTLSQIQLKNSVLALLLCNNVTPSFKDSERNLQGSSPDEISLAGFAEKLGFFLESRRTNSIKIRNPLGQIEDYEILENFAFTSERKRMGILLRHIASDQHLFFLKGADSVLVKVLISSEELIFAQENCENLSKEGLRTLVLSIKTISREDYLKWKYTFKQASQNLNNRNENQKNCIDQLEKNMSLLGVTAVKDLLQEDVKICITNIRNAGIKIWMLTGDKLETAKCIAISTGFKNQSQKFYEINSLDEHKILSDIELFIPSDSVLLVSGDTLDVILANDLICDAFFSKAVLAKSVVLCRCAPQVKAEIALILKQQYNKVVCCVGDGGNDTFMIKAASVGVGIEGREGLQASLVSDFSIRQFKDLLPLFLWHGRLSYVRTTTIANLVIHRGFILTTIQYIFMTLFYFNTVNIYNGYLHMFYGTWFTNFLVISLVFDQDIPKHQAFNYPSLYKYIQEGGDLNLKMFLVWVFKGVFQGAVIILLSVLLFDNTFMEIITITFTALILTEYLTIMTIVRTCHFMISVGILLSFICFLGCLFFLPHLFLFSKMSTVNYLKTVFLVMCGWFPIYLFYVIKRKLFPTHIDKIVKEVRIQNYMKKVNKN